MTHAEALAALVIDLRNVCLAADYRAELDREMAAILESQGIVLGPEDWHHEQGPRGGNKWISKTGRVVYQKDNPGGAGKGKAVVAGKPATPPDKLPPSKPRPTADTVHAEIAVMIGGDKQLNKSHVAKAATLLQSLTVPQIKEVKQKLGLKASGTKAKMAEQIAVRAVASAKNVTSTVKAAAKPVSPTARTPEQVQAFAAKIKTAISSGTLTAAQVPKIAAALGELTLAQMQDVKKQLGLRVGGAKAVQAKNIAAKALAVVQKANDDAAKAKAKEELKKAKEEAKAAAVKAKADAKTKAKEDNVAAAIKAKADKEAAKTAKTPVKPKSAPKGLLVPFGTPDHFEKTVAAALAKTGKTPQQALFAGSAGETFDAIKANGYKGVDWSTVKESLEKLAAPPKAGKLPHQRAAPENQPNPLLADDTRPDVTAEEARAIELYTDVYYNELNYYLRTEEKPSMPTEGVHKQMQTAFAKVPVLTTPVPVRRGFNLSASELPAFLKIMQTGQASGGPVRFPGYTSTSTGTGFRNKNVNMEIDAIQGLDVKPYSANPTEDELLLNHGSGFRIKNVTSTPTPGGYHDAIWTVHLEQLPPGWEKTAGPIISGYTDVLKPV